MIQEFSRKRKVGHVGGDAKQLSTTFPFTFLNHEIETTTKCIKFQLLLLRFKKKINPVLHAPTAYGPTAISPLINIIVLCSSFSLLVVQLCKLNWILWLFSVWHLFFIIDIPPSIVDLWYPRVKTRKWLNRVQWTQSIEQENWKIA